MGHLVKQFPWGTVDLDFLRGHVFVREDWRYADWRLDTEKHGDLPSPGAWTHSEKVAFHNSVDQLIWAFWSLRAEFRIEPRPQPGAFARRFVDQFLRKPLTLSFDVRRVHSRAHWSVFVTKYNPDIKEKPRAEVDVPQRRIFLTTFDTVPLTASRQTPDAIAGPRKGESDPEFRTRIAPARSAEKKLVTSRIGEKRFRVAPHEFGHTLGSVDEYNPNSRFYDDLHSVMNVGRRVRPRHLELVRSALHELVPGCSFIAVTTGEV
jgi:hypothetical protein